MKSGQRTSEQSKLMEAAVKDLNIDDMIALAAYVSAQQP
jgi:cytochrome c553